MIPKTSMQGFLTSVSSFSFLIFVHETHLTLDTSSTVRIFVSLLVISTFTYWDLRRSVGRNGVKVQMIILN